MTWHPEQTVPSASRQSELDQVSLLWILAVALRERRTILGITGLGVAITLVVALLRSPTYTTTFSFVPQTTQDAGRAGLANLAGQFGLPLGVIGGAAQSPQFYADLLSTRSILAPIAADSFAASDDRALHVKLSNFLGTSGSNEAVELENTIRALRERVIGSSVATRNTGVVTVTVRTRSAAVSFGVAARLMEGLNEFNLQTRQSQAGAERRFIEGRLSDARDSLRAAEDALQRFLQSNRQIENFSQLSFGRDRLQRDVTLRQQLVNGLAQQYEDARIREVRDTPVITVIERPATAVRPDPRGRVVLLMAGAAVGFLLGLSLALMRQGIGRHWDQRGAPAVAMLAAEWQQIRRAGS
jgi:uncharacterized protein involved in exopolysaccharide biosynthesis